MEDENRTVTDGQPATEAQDASPRVDDHPLKGPAPPADKNGKKTEKIKGVFSTQIIQKVGTGTTTRKTVKKSYWFVDEIDNNVIEIQPLNVNYVPSGPKRRIPKEDFLEKFSPEPEFYVSTVFPNMRKLNQNIKKGEEHREKGESFSAELEFNNALTIDEDNVRANFGLGLTYLERGEDKKSQDIFQRLVKLDAAFEPKHKHLFNEFGINLRKNKMYEEALQYYDRALTLHADDENLHYNIARAYFEKQAMDKVVLHLEKSLELNPALEEARKFMDYLAEKGFIQARAGGGNGSGEEEAEEPEEAAPEEGAEAKAPKNPETDYKMDI